MEENTRLELEHFAELARMLKYIDRHDEHEIKSKGYEDVTVYTSTETPRAKHCSYDKFVSLWSEARGKYGEDFYQVKDKAMCMACDIAVAFWNGSSYGVKCNIIRCLDLHKTCLVYVSEIKDGDTEALREVIDHAAGLEDQKKYEILDCSVMRFTTHYSVLTIYWRTSQN